MPARPARQLPLPITHAQSFARADFLGDETNAEALAWLDRPQDWPNGRLLLWGPEGCGKTHLLRATAAREGWRVLDGCALRGLPEPGPAAVDDADCLPDDRALLHLVNLCAERGDRLLLAAREPPSRWRIALPDLASRLRATTAVALLPPGDDLLAALLAKLLADRQLRVAADVQAWLLARLPRTPAALGEAVARLDQAGLAARLPITRALARTTLAAWEGFSPVDDGTETNATGGSPPPVPLL